MSWPKVLLIYTGLVATFVLYGRLNFYRDPGSIFFDESRAFNRRYSAYREQEIKAFEADLAHHERVSERAGRTPSICASFISVRRESIQYLPGLTQCERRDLHVNILLAHTNLVDHPSYNLPWLHGAVDSMHGYDVSTEQLSILRMLEERKDHSSKGVLDYYYALDNCYKTGSPWIIVFEDDILLADGWHVKTLQGLQTLHNQFSTSPDEWLFLRLFNQERSIGWASNDIGGNHQLPISIAIMLVSLPSLMLVRSKSSTVRKKLGIASIGIICFLLVPTSVILFFQAGKMSMLPPRAGVHREPFGCCSQALVFPRTHVPRIKEYLLSRKSGQIDLMLDDLAVKDSLDRYALYPVQLQHIGKQSVRWTAAREAQAIWSMAFENQDPTELRDIHMKLADKIYDARCTIRKE